MYNITKKIDSSKMVCEVWFNDKLAMVGNIPEDGEAVIAKVHNLIDTCGLNEMPVQVFTLFANVDSERRVEDNGPQSIPAPRKKKTTK